MMRRERLLPLCGDIRRCLDGIHELAAAVEGDLARYQIYGEVDAIPHALRKVGGLKRRIALVERKLRACAKPGASVHTTIAGGRAHRELPRSHRASLGTVADQSA